MWDVVIVGAGPAGSNAATVALKAGLSVIQIDKASFPRLKPCAGGLTTKSLNSVQLPIDSMIRKQSNLVECNIWNGEVNQLFHKKIVISMVVRPEFDNFLVEQNSKQKSFVFLDNNAVKGVSYNGQYFTVNTEKGPIIGQQLIGADGANGLVNRTFKITKPRLAYAVEINPRNNLLETKKELHPCIDLCVLRQGYGWIFPKDDQHSIGLYSLTSGIPKIKLLLKEYLRVKGIRIEGDPLATFEAHPIPVAGYRINTPQAPVYIVGDAGGFADAILGEGIYYALESGRLAGLTAVSVNKKSGAHTDYYKAIRSSILPDTFLTYWLARQFIYGEYRGVGWQIGKRLLQRLLLESYAEGLTFTEGLLKAGIYIPKSFKDSSVKVETPR